MSLSPQVADAKHPVHVRLLLSLAVGTVLLTWLPGVLGPYGLFIDEFYYLACARRPDWGYVDHPPLCVAVLALVRQVAGDSPLALRLPPALASGATVWLTGRMAARLGAGAFGQALAAVSMALAPIALVIGSFYSMNAFDLLLWAACFSALLAVADGHARGWLWFGLWLGLGLLNKHTIALLLVGLLPGMVATRARRQFATRTFWLGALVAGLLVLPNVVWQVAHGWPSLEFYANADRLKNNPTPAAEVVLQQILFMNPLAVPVWGAGLAFLLGKGRGGALRHLAFVYLVVLALLALGHKSRPDRLTPAYSLLFAAGGAALDTWLAGRHTRRLRPVLLAAVVVGAGPFLPLGVPVLPPATVAAYGQRLGLVPQIERGAGKRAALPQWLADRLEWHELVDQVARVVAELPAQERASAVIVAPSYGQAGALEHLGRDLHLPPVYSGHNNYFLWGPPPESLTTAIVLGYDESTLRGMFAEVVRAEEHRCTWCTPWRDRMPIWIARRPRGSIAAAWPRLAHYE